MALRKDAQQIAQGLIQSYIGRDHKVINTARKTGDRFGGGRCLRLAIEAPAMPVSTGRGGLAFYLVSKQRLRPQMD